MSQADCADEIERKCFIERIRNAQTIVGGLSEFIDHRRARLVDDAGNQGSDHHYRKRDFFLRAKGQLK